MGASAGIFSASSSVVPHGKRDEIFFLMNRALTSCEWIFLEAKIHDWVRSPARRGKNRGARNGQARERRCGTLDMISEGLIGEACVGRKMVVGDGGVDNFMAWK